MAKKNKSVSVVPQGQAFQAPTSDGGERFTTVCVAMRQQMLARMAQSVRSRLEPQMVRMTRAQLEQFEASLVERALPNEHEPDVEPAFTTVALGAQRIDPVDAWVALQAVRGA